MVAARARLSDAPSVSTATRETDVSDFCLRLEQLIDDLLIKHVGDLRSHLDTKFAQQDEGVSVRSPFLKHLSNGSKQSMSSNREMLQEQKSREEHGPKRLTIRDREKRTAAMSIAVQSAKKAEKKDPAGIGETIRRALRTNVFEYTIGLLILSNAVFIGVQVNYKANHLREDLPFLMVVMQYAYTIIFAIELFVRIAAEGLREFFASEDNQGWNIVDFIIVLISLVELPIRMLFSDSSGSNLLVLRLIRILRIIRIVRVIRVMRFFRPLRVLLLAIASTLKSAVWTLSLLCLILFGFGIVFAQGAVDYVLDQGIDDSTGTLQQHWGTLPRSVFTLFKSISGGLDWQDAIQPLSDLGWVFVVFFVFFMAFVQIAVMNVVTGIFVSTAMESAQKDSDIIIAEQKSASKIYAKQLQQIMGLAPQFKKSFSGSSSDGKGSTDGGGGNVISLHDFEVKLCDEKVSSFFEALDIDTSDAWTLFKLLDRKETGFVMAEEFIEGCMRMRGAAKNVQLANLQYETKHMRSALMDFMQHIEEELEGVAFRLETLVYRRDAEMTKAFNEGLEEKIQAKISLFSRSPLAVDPHLPSEWTNDGDCNVDEIRLDHYVAV